MGAWGRSRHGSRTMAVARWWGGAVHHPYRQVVRHVLHSREVFVTYSRVACATDTDVNREAVRNSQGQTETPNHKPHVGVG